MNPQPIELDQTRLKRSDSAEQSVSPLTVPAPVAGPVLPLTPEQQQEVEERVVAALKTCYDPEIPVNIYELGLIYGVEVEATGAVHVRMTLTSPMCPVAGSLPPEIESKLRAVPGVTAAKVEVVWEPQWDKNMMSEAAQLQLGLFD